MIKNVLSYFVLLVIVLASGCSSGDEPGAEEAGLRDLLVGKWYQVEYKSPSSGTFIGQEDGSFFEFKSSGSFTYFYSGWGSFDETQTGTFSVSGSSRVDLLLSDGSSGSLAVLQLEGSAATFVLSGIGAGTFKYVKR